MSVTEAWSAPYTTTSISLAQYTIATSAGVTIASGNLIVASGGTAVISGTAQIFQIDMEYAGAQNIASGAAEQVVAFTISQPNTSYYVQLSPRFNSQSEGGLWVSGRSTNSFMINVGSGQGTSSSVVDWAVFR
jgi:hypothetical protein